MIRIDTKHWLLRIRRKLCERLNIYRYSKTGAWSILNPILGGAPGTFIEAGAHDGWTGSNTYWLECVQGWRGILIEPVPDLYRECKKERPLAKVFHGALVSRDYENPTVDIECSGLVSAVTGSPMLKETREVARAYYGVTLRPVVSVPALTLDGCVEASGFDRVDFVSLDVEGFEEQALRGFNLDRWKPRWLLIECNSRTEVLAMLGSAYRIAQELPPRDVLFVRTD